jgi:outer membrane murein-binding lipoprotein Lpp
MPNPEQTNPYDVVAVLKQAARHPSEPPKRLAFPPRRSSLGRLALKGLIGLLVAAGIGAAAIVSLSDGDAAKQVIAQWWEPQLSLISSLAAKSPVPVQSSPVPAVQEQLQSIARGLLAAVEDEMEQLKTSIEQLKTNQEQIVRDNAAVAEQLKATKEQSGRDNAAIVEQLKAIQEQLGRVIAKASEQQLQPKTPAPPRSIATPKGKTVPKQASAQPPVPVQGRPKQQ